MPRYTFHDFILSPRRRLLLRGGREQPLILARRDRLRQRGGRPLVGGTIHAIATQSGGSQAALTPLGRLIGEPDFGPVTRAIIGTGEAVIFGLGLALGLTRRPK